MWVQIAISWGMVASAVIIVLPVYESRQELWEVLTGIIEGRRHSATVRIASKQPQPEPEDPAKDEGGLQIYVGSDLAPDQAGADAVARV